MTRWPRPLPSPQGLAGGQYLLEGLGTPPSPGLGGGTGWRNLWTKAGRRVGSWGWRTEPRSLPPWPHPTPPTHTHSGQRLCAGRSGLAAQPISGIQALGTKAFLGSCVCVEGLGMLHREAGARPRRARRAAGGEHRCPTQRTGSESCGVLFVWLLRAAGSRLRPAHWSEFRVMAEWGVGRGGPRNQGNQRWASQRVWWTSGAVC